MIDINILLLNDESEILDYKREWHANKASLVHDVLALSNSIAKSDRYLILGVSDDKQIFGVENDQNRKTQAQLIDFLRSIHLNSIPNIKLYNFEHGGHSIDIIEIKDVPEKPYFLTRDYTDRGTTIRSGVIFTRDGDSNTPLDRSASEVKIEKMFQERFGILESPSERFKRYLMDKKNWRYGYNETNALYFYYTPFPEFTILSNDRNEHEDFSEPWLSVFPDSKGSRDEMLLKYHTTVMEKIYIIWCDGARLAMVMPNQATIDPNGVCATSYYYINNSIKFLTNEMIDHVYPNHSRNYIDDVFSFFDSRDEAEHALDNDYNNGNPSHYTYFEFNQSDRAYYLVNSTGRRKLVTR